MVKNSNNDLGLAATTEEVFLFGQAQASGGQAQEARADPSEDIKVSKPLHSSPLPAPAPSELPPLDGGGALEPLPSDTGGKILSESPQPPPLPKALPHRKVSKKAAELAAMITQDLSQHPDAPKQGLKITVYGGTHWRAMLTITPAAGRIRDPQALRDLTNEPARRLRKHYDMAWE
jgi:hypothetical protein